MRATSRNSCAVGAILWTCFTVLGCGVGAEKSDDKRTEAPPRITAEAPQEQETAAKRDEAGEPPSVQPTDVPPAMAPMDEKRSPAPAEATKAFGPLRSTDAGEPLKLPRHTFSRSDPPRAAPPAESVESSSEPRTAAVEPDGPKEVDGSTPAEEPFSMLTVFYATDRQALDAAALSPFSAWGLLPMGLGLLVTIVFAIAGFMGLHRPQLLGLSVVSLLLTAGLAYFWGSDQLNEMRRYAQPDVRYGNGRGQLEVGTCEVSIPWTHEVGELETPSILRLEVREDVRKHVVLHQTQRKHEDEFYQQLRERVQSAASQDVFVFVHGYNVTFEDAARRTAQIAFDVGFEGAPIFYSWPSQGGLLQYAVDETNATWSVPHLKQFLLDVVNSSGAKAVNLIAHSMGNRALANALREVSLELREGTTLFNQVVLAAPDVDAEIFRRDLAPALLRSAERVTLYASSNDQALIASKKVHGYPRAGESGDGLLVVQGIDTIDVSMIDTGMLGHSYYGSSNPILMDIRQMIQHASPAGERRWLRPVPLDGLTYWVFEQIRGTAGRPADRRQ